MEEFRNQWLNTKFGRFVTMLIIDIAIILIINLGFSNSSFEETDFYKLLQVSTFTVIPTSFCIFLYIDTFGFVDIDDVMDYILTGILFIILIAGKIFVFIYIDAIEGLEYASGVPNDPFEIAMIFTLILYNFIFFLCLYLGEKCPEIVSFNTIIGFIATYLLGLLYGVMVQNAESKFLIYWLPCLMCVGGYFGYYKIADANDISFPDIDSDEFDFPEFILPLGFLFKYLGIGIFYAFKYLGIGLYYLIRLLGLGIFYAFKYLGIGLYLAFRFLILSIVNLFQKLSESTKNRKPKAIKYKEPKKPKVIKNKKSKKHKETNNYKEETEEIKFPRIPETKKIISEHDFEISYLFTRLSGRIGFFIKNCFGWLIYEAGVSTYASQSNPYSDVKNIFLKQFSFRRAKGYREHIIFNITEKISNGINKVRFYIESMWETFLVLTVVTIAIGFPVLLIFLLIFYAVVILIALIGRLERKIFKLDKYYQSENDILSGGDGNIELEYKYTFKGILGFFKKCFLKCFGYVNNFQFELDAKYYFSNASEMRKEKKKIERSKSYDKEKLKREIKDIINNNKENYRNEVSYLRNTYHNTDMSYAEFTGRIKFLEEQTKKNLDEDLDKRVDDYNERQGHNKQINKSEVYEAGYKKVAKITQMIRPKYFSTNIIYAINEKLANLCYMMLLPLLALGIIYCIDGLYTYLFIFGGCILVIIVCCLLSMLLRKIYKIDELAWKLEIQSKIKAREEKKEERDAKRSHLKTIDIILICIPIINLIYEVIISLLVSIRVISLERYWKIQSIGFVTCGITIMAIFMILIYFYPNLFI